MDRVKEALFNILGDDILGSHFLDLYAGTGSVGIEALSRGAEFSLFIDKNRSAVSTIRKNLLRTRLECKAVVRRIDAFHLLKRPPARRYDYIFVAPPQYQDLWWKTLAALSQHDGWQHADTRIIVQMDPREFDGARLPRQLTQIDQRKYGGTLLLFYQFASSAPSEGAGERRA